MRLSLLSQLFGAAAMAAHGAATLADPAYDVTVLAGTGSAAADINNRGDVVGHFAKGGATRGVSSSDCHAVRLDPVSAAP